MIGPLNSEGEKEWPTHNDESGDLDQNTTLAQARHGVDGGSLVLHVLEGQALCWCTQQRLAQILRRQAAVE